MFNKIGSITNRLWLNIPVHFPCTEQDEYIIMPNQIHGIIIISYDNNFVGNENLRPLHRTNLSNVIKGFKIGLTKWYRNNGYNDFRWQKSFYDRIIRNERELFNIRNYIKLNPLKWELEKNTENIELY